MREIRSAYFFCALLINIFFIPNIHSDKNYYLFPNSQFPSISNYGTTGLLQVPTARLLPEGSLAFNYIDNGPYRRMSYLAYPFSWLEASYQYTDILNALYSDVFAFSGNQTYKDKSFDFKIKVINESKYFPAIAVGFRDLAGTSVFASEYIVASKKFNNLDLTLGAGFGVMSRDTYSNPLKRINNNFSIREKELDTRGGDVNFGYLFSGDFSLFGGIEYSIPNFYGTRIRVEYDPINYKKEGFPFGRDSFKFAFKSIQQPSAKINFGLLFPYNDNLHFKLGYTKGNTINFGFSLQANLGKKSTKLLKNNKFEENPQKDLIKVVTAKDNSLLYKAALKYLSDQNFYLQKANIKDDTLHVVYQQSIHNSWTRSNGRVLRILDEISPPKIKHFKVSNINAGLDQYTLEVDREKFSQYKKDNYYPLLTRDIRYDQSSEEEEFEFLPEVKRPSHFYKFGPIIRSQLGGPDGFFFGNLRFSLQTETLFSSNINLVTVSSVGLYDNFDRLNNNADSILPHVRTDVVRYLKEQRSFGISRFQLNYFNKFNKDFYWKFSAGVIETMFSAFGGELLYRPFHKNYGVGVDIWQAKQRDYDGLFDHLDYSVLTGHLNLYYIEPKYNIEVKVKAGRFLAKDSGFNFDFSRRFKSGLRVGAFFSLTDISNEEFGEGSFDKGFYFYIPVDVLSNTFSKRKSHFGLRPVTRDGAAYLEHGFSLWGITEQAQLYNHSKDFDDFYD